MADNDLFVHFFFRGMRTCPTTVLTPAKVMFDAGFTKEMVQQHFHDNAKLWVDNLRGMIVQRFYRGIDAGNWPSTSGPRRN